MDTTIREALTAAEFDTDTIEVITLAEKKEGAVQNWTEPQFKDVLGSIPGTAAFAVLRRLRTPSSTPVATATRLPEKPPYLYNKAGEQVSDYDPSDPTQYWEAPTGELWRWDGKRDRSNGRTVKNLMGFAIEKTRFPFGEPHPVMKVDHKTIDGIAVPDSKQVTEARLGGYDWFHVGLGVWIGGAKPRRPFDASLLRRVKDAAERLGGGNPAIVRNQ